MGRGAAGPMLERLGRRDAQWLLLMSLTLFAVLLPSFSYIAALSLIKEEWDLNNTQAGAIISAGLGAYAVAALVLIPMTDRLGPKRILLPAVAVSVAANVLFPLVARGMVTASLVQAAIGVGLAGTYMPGARVVSERFAAGGRGMAIGLFVTAFYAANSVSLVATGSLMGAVDWRDAYLVVALASAASVPMAYLALRDHRQDTASSSSGRLSLGVLGVRRVRYFVFGYTLHTAELFTARAWFPAFLVSVLVARGSEADGAAATAATVAGLVMAAGAVGPVMGGMISDRLGRVASASAIFALSGACSWAIGWMGGLPWGLIVGVGVAYGWATAADSAIYTTAVAEAAKPRHLGSTLAVHAFVGFMAGAVGPSAFGAVLDAAPEAHRFGFGFSAVGVLSVVAVAALIRLGASREALRETAGGGPTHADG